MHRTVRDPTAEMGKLFDSRTSGYFFHTNRYRYNVIFTITDYNFLQWKSKTFTTEILN